jgi:hypothetical protein
MERNLSRLDIEMMDKDYDDRVNWDGVERRKGVSYIPQEMERRKHKWTPKLKVVK